MLPSFEEPQEWLGRAREGGREGREGREGRGLELLAEPGKIVLPGWEVQLELCLFVNDRTLGLVYWVGMADSTF